MTCSHRSTSSHFPLASAFFPSSVSLPGCGGGTNELSRQERKMKEGGGAAMFSSAECARTYERRSIYFRTLAWVCAQIWNTLALPLAHAHMRTLWRSESSQAQRQAWPTFSTSLLLKAARRTLSVWARRPFRKPESSECITHQLTRTHRHTHRNIGRNEKEWSTVESKMLGKVEGWGG